MARSIHDAAHQSLTDGAEDYVNGHYDSCRVLLAAEPQGEGWPSETELYDLADEYSGEPVASMRAALARWGRPAAPPAEGEVAGKWPQYGPHRAFVAGAKWWQYTANGATMWPADVDRAEDEAVRRYGNPAAPPPAEGEAAELVAWLSDVADQDFALESNLRRVAALLQQQHPQPVPVSERLPDPRPEAEGGDCDAEGKCWMFSKINPEWRLLSVLNPGVPHLHYCFSHWRPFRALPLPTSGEVDK